MADLAAEGPLNAKFNKRVTSIIERFHVPGISISVVDGERTFAKGYGISSFPDQQATPETLYYCGSTTKSFTAASIVKLIEQSKRTVQQLGLNTKIRAILSDDFALADQYATEHVTLEDVLSHRTGLARHNYSLGNSKETLVDSVRRLRHLPMSVEIREKWQYCNLMYGAAGHIIEKLTGSRLCDVFRENIWNPLNMHSTFLSLEHAQSVVVQGSAKLAKGYWWDDSSQDYIVAPYIEDISMIGGAGGTISNVLDYAKYLRAMIAKDKTVLSSKGFDELRTPRVVIPSAEHSAAFTGPEMYGLGWTYAVYHGHELFFHGGGISGFGMQMAYMPTLSNGIGLTLMTNSEGTSNYAAQILLFDIVDNIMGLQQHQRFDWLQHFSSIVDTPAIHMDATSALAKIYPDSPKSEGAHPLELPPESYTGEYWDDGYGRLSVQLMEEGEFPLRPTALRVDVSERAIPHEFRLEHVGANSFLAWMSGLNGVSCPRLNQVLKASFDVNSTGQVTKFGIAYDDTGSSDMIWFDKLDHSKQQ